MSTSVRLSCVLRARLSQLQDLLHDTTYYTSTSVR